jgi:HSP20 family protein
MAIEFWRPRSSVMRRPQQREMSRREPEFGDMVEQFFRGWPWSGGGESLGWAPPIDVVDRPNEILVRADLPGVTEKDLQVTVNDRTLSIHGERKEEHEEKDENYYFSERSSGSFTRSLVIPTGVNADQTEAKFKNGVLEIHLPKAQESTGKRIEVKAA